ncbi:MAG: FAD-dependent oxidoreductase [Saprospiraceae bacterium]|nr:FAD-dependent oxidoreductase [Saprospiraceae bacterium]
MASSNDFDCIIVGQGLAGTLLSYFLLLENQRVAVIDYPIQGRTSHIAAGLINPVTGRRIAKSWRFEELVGFARQTYEALELKLSIALWKDQTIHRALHNTFEENEWLRRSSFPEFQAYLFDEPSIGEIKDKIHEPHGWGELRGAAQIALPLLIEKWKEQLVNQGLYFNEIFDYQQLRFENDRINYRDLSAEKMIFCEGAKATENPFFNHLPFLPTKGELLLVRFHELNFEQILKHNLFLIPMGNGIYWVGATSRYEYDGPNPSDYARKYLINELDKTVKVSYEIISHEAGIRPTVADVRPLLGRHSEFHNLFIFNGLGTKGALMGPFFAQQMAKYLVGFGGLDEDVDIKRFDNLDKKGHFFKTPGQED